MMTAGEVVKHFTLGDTLFFGDNSKLGEPKSDRHQAADKETLDYKLNDAKHDQSYDGKTSLYNSIASKGVQEPIQVSSLRDSKKRPSVVNGHHRLAVTHNLNPNQFMNFEYL
jgi:hypothetical protein